MKRRHNLGLLTPDARQAPFAEFHVPTNRWRIWQAYNGDITSGSYIILHPTGMSERVTVLDNDIVDITILTGPVLSPESLE